MLRDKNTNPKQFRELIRELSNLVIFQASKSLTLVNYSVQTPLMTCNGFQIKEKIALVPILRAGLGMVEGALQLFPEAEVYHIGMYRDKKSLQPVEYYSKLPNNVKVDVVYVLEPMIATGGTASATIALLKEWGAPRVEMISFLASELAIEKLIKEHPDVKIHVCAIDPKLNDHGYILPGLGDAGDRQFSTPH